MTNAHVARLHNELQLVTYLTPKPGVSGAPPGVARLDFWSGLFLERGETEGEWVLEGCTWGHPPESLVHDWHVRAALVAKRLDQAVEIPKPAPAETASDEQQLECMSCGWKIFRRHPGPHGCAGRG